jgi:hypothetical protein
MAPVTVIVGVLLVAVGVVGFVVGLSHTEHIPYTALIPAWIGLAFIVLGLLSFKDGLRKHTMHAAAALGLLAFLATGYMGIPKLITLLSGGTVERPVAVYSQVTTAAICLVFVALCVNSFIAARRRRAEAASRPSS